MKLRSLFILLICCNCNYPGLLYAQEKKAVPDSFFLLRKKGIIGKLAKSISTSGEYVKPIKTVDQYKQFQGKFIRSVIVLPVDFNEDLITGQPIHHTFAVQVANLLHRTSHEKTIRKNLFFKEGELFYPLVVADNERFLREQPFLRDALIKVYPAENSPDSVEVLVFSRDVFSIGGSVDASSFSRLAVEVKEENLAGVGDRLSVSAMHDLDRSPANGIGAEFTKRNIKGSFINWSNGFSTFNRSFNSGRREELEFYSSIEKPMASRYTAVTGEASLSFHKTINGYLQDSLYFQDFHYKYLNADVWAGYNFGNGTRKLLDDERRLRHFVAVRGFYNLFTDVPLKFRDNYNFRYADINGFLVSYSLYRQNFYRTNFIYGFGRNEDLPEGINASVVTGFTNKQGVRRAYYGLEFEASRFNKHDAYYSYIFKTGGYFSSRSLQDVDVLVNVDHFTSLKKLSAKWYNRSRMGVSYSRQINRLLNEPLFIESVYGLPYYRNKIFEADMRATIKFESVFFNLHKIAGFRLAPFIFSDLSFLTPVNESFGKSRGFPALGGGLRTRNENLIFGTIELRGYVFPRVMDGMQNWKVELSTKLQFKYNSNFIRRPEFVSLN